MTIKINLICCMNNRLRQFLLGVRLSALLIVPFWIVTGLIDYQFPQLLNSKTYFLTGQILLVVVYLIAPTYYLTKKVWLALLGALTGGALVIVVTFFVGLFISCSQGVCF